MNCPKCGYVMSAFDPDCPRCKNLANQTPTPQQQVAPQTPQATPQNLNVAAHNPQQHNNQPPLVAPQQLLQQTPQQTVVEHKGTFSSGIGAGAGLGIGCCCLFPFIVFMFFFALAVLGSMGS